MILLNGLFDFKCVKGVYMLPFIVSLIIQSVFV